MWKNKEEKKGCRRIPTRGAAGKLIIYEPRIDLDDLVMDQGEPG